MAQDAQIPQTRKDPALASAWLGLAVVNGEQWKIPLLLFTDRRFIISKERIIGKPKADLALPWANVSTIGPPGPPSRLTWHSR